VGAKTEALAKKLEQEKEKLIRLLEDKKKETEKYSKELGMRFQWIFSPYYVILDSTENEDRYKTLHGDDPSPDLLGLKIEALEEETKKQEA
jgi:hypothetical protein